MYKRQLLSRTAKRALKEGLTGLEFAAGIPGTIGGALVMNAGAYGSEIKEMCIRDRATAMYTLHRSVWAATCSRPLRHWLRLRHIRDHL